MKKRFLIATMSVMIFLNLVVGNALAAGIKGRVDFQIEKSNESVFVVDEKPAVDIKITIPQQTEDTFAIRLITDYTNFETVNLNNQGTQQLHLEFAVQDEGYHNLCAQLLHNGVLYYEYEFEQYYISSVSNTAYSQRGFNIHYDADKDFSDDGTMLKASGTPVVRVGLSWNGVEKEKGVYDFSNADEMFASLGEYDLDCVCIIDSYHFGNELYPDENGDPMMRTEEQINAFADFAIATVKRYPQVKKWEIFNEPNFLMTGEEYFNVVYTVAKRIKEYDPQNEVYAGGLAIYDTGNFVNGFYVDKLYPYIDGISYHHYNHWRYADGPEYYQTTEEIADKMMQEGGWKKLIMTESGYSTGIHDMEVPENKQASENVKRAVICDWYGIDFLTLYDFKNDGYDPEEIEHNFGSVTNDYKPKPGYYTMKQYLDATNQAIYIGEAYLSDDITAHVYAANDDYFMIAWAKNINDEADIRNENGGKAVYNFTDENVRVENMFGEHIGGKVLNATYEPSYIYGLSKDFCFRAIRENRDHDLFENIRKLMDGLGYSTEEIENIYLRMCTSGSTDDAQAFMESCYGMADQISDDFLDGVLDISEREFSNILSEIYQICERGMRVAVLFDDKCSAPDNVYEEYENVQTVPQDAVDKNVVYINEPYYKGKNLLNKISLYNEKDRVNPVKGQGFELKSDNLMIFYGESSVEEVLIKIEDNNGNLIYMNLIPTDGSGNYYFEFTPDMPYGNYKVTVNNGEILTDNFDYNAAVDYLSVEDKMTAISLLQAQELLNMYQKNLEWAQIKNDYLNPEIDALVWDETKWINITGKIERPGWTQYSDVILTAYDKNTNQLKYIDTTYINEDGEFRFSFKYDDDANNLDIRINQGGVNIEKYVQSITESKLITGNLLVTNSGGAADVTINLENYFKTDKTIEPVIAYYDETNKLIGCKVIESEKIKYDESSKYYKVEIPEGTAVVKVFAWNDLTYMLPYTDSASSEIAG